jgi:hypothetical protein
MDTTHSIGCFRSNSVISIYPAMRFTAVTAEGIQPSAFKKRVSEFAMLISASLKDKDPSRESCLQEFERFFRVHQHSFPLNKQIMGAAARGFPPAPGPVLALLALEAATGVLMGVQDLDTIEGHITLDALQARESFTGMRGKDVICSPGEVVVRDDKAIIASLFQGPDRRTAVKSDSRNILFYVFDTDTSLDTRHEHAVTMVTDLFPAQVAETTTILSAA